jgi:hypothetical protein
MKTRRSFAWGVLGSTTGGYRFSLLTLLFSGVIQHFKPGNRKKSLKIS